MLRPSSEKPRGLINEKAKSRQTSITSHASDKPRQYLQKTANSIFFYHNLINTSWPLSLYLIVAVSIFIGVLLLLDFEGIKQFSISISLLGAMGVFYVIDTFRPYSTASLPNFLSPLPSARSQNGFSIQGFVPFTSSIVAMIMQRIGYAVQMVLVQDEGVQMLVNGYPFLVYWPCAGIHSLFICTFVILLFLKVSPMSLRAKLGCLVLGAVGTFFVNVLRIISIINNQ